MERESAHRLWQSTLAFRLLGEDAARDLGAVWSDCGVSAAQQERLAAALRSGSGPLERREAVIRETRRLIREAGFDPDLLSTPAAGMRGL